MSLDSLTVFRLISLRAFDLFAYVSIVLYYICMHVVLL